MISSYQLLKIYGEPILKSPGMKKSLYFRQHGNVSVFQHSVSVAALSLIFARNFSWKIDESSLIRGALLHDYYQYDWHHPGHFLHGFTHPKTALKCAERDFALNPVEKDIIAKHMFPLTVLPPRTKEAFLVCLADKLCALYETLSHFNFPKEDSHDAD